MKEETNFWRVLATLCLMVPAILVFVALPLLGVTLVTQTFFTEGSSMRVIELEIFRVVAPIIAWGLGGPLVIWQVLQFLGIHDLREDFQRDYDEEHHLPYYDQDDEKRA